MSSSPYRLFPQILVRITGVPFDALRGIGTPGAAAAARTALAHEAAARTAAAALLSQAAERAAARGEKDEKLARKLDALRPVSGTGLVALEAAYEAARAAYEQATGALPATLDHELALARASLREQSARHLPGFTVFTAELGDAELFSAERLAGELPALNSKERQRERTYLMYLQRVAAKNDTISAYGPTAWGTIKDGPATSLAPIPGIAARDVYVEKWVVNAVAAAITADPEARLELVPRLHPAGRLEGSRFVRVDRNASEAGAVVELEPELAALAALVDGVRPAYALVAASKPGQLDALLERGVIRWEQETVVLLAHRLEVVRDDVRAWRPGPARDRWLAALDALFAEQQRFMTSTAPNERRAAMEHAAELAHKLGAKAKETSRTALYRGATALSEDCVRDVNLTLAADVARVVSEDAAPFLDLWRDCYSHLAHRLAERLRPLVEETPTVAGKRLLPAFLAHCASRGIPIQANGMLDLVAPAVDELRAAFGAMLETKPADAEEWQLSERDCAVVRDRLSGKRIDEFTLPAVDFMVSARSLAELNRGDYEVVVGELHAPIVTLQHCFSWANPDVAGFARGLGESMGPGANMFHYGNVRVQATCHTSVDFHRAMPGRFALASLERGLPSWPVVPAADVEVFVDDDGDVKTRAPDGRVLGSFARDWFVVWIAFHPFVFYRSPHLPRLRVGRCVVQRRTWLVERGELDGGEFTGTDARLTLAIERLRARRGMPRWVFVRPVPTFFAKTLTGKDKDHKPVCVDLESYMCCEVLAAWVRKYPLLEVTEMLPDPDHLWWREPDGAYTFELRALVVPK